MSPASSPETPDSPAVLRRRLAELATLYEVARGLIGVHVTSPDDVAEALAALGI